MNIYVGRWDLLPKEWEGINGLDVKTEREIVAEVGREIDAWAERHEKEDNLMGAYMAHEFEDTFNLDTENKLTTETYWIKIF